MNLHKLNDVALFMQNTLFRTLNESCVMYTIRHRRDLKMSVKMLLELINSGE